MRQSLYVSLAISFLLVAVTANPWGLRVNAQAPQTINPDDPDYTSRIGDQMNWPEAWYFEQQMNAATGPNFDEVDVVILDTGVDPTDPDLVGQCRTDLFENVSGDGLPPLNICTALHGTSMAGNADALTNNGQFVASAPGLIPGTVKIISIKWNNGQTGNPDNARQGLQDVLTLKLTPQGPDNVPLAPNIKVVSFSSEEEDDNPTATQSVLTQLRDAGVAVLSPPLGMVGTYANDPRFSVISLLELDQTGEAPYLDSDAGVTYGNLGVPGNGVNLIIPITDPCLGPGSGSGLETGDGGVSSSVSLAAGCLAALIQWGPEKDALRAVRRLELTATMFDGLKGHADYGRIDLYAALTAPVELPAAPVIADLTYNGKKLVIRGKGFGKEPGVMINGVDVSTMIVSSTKTVIKLKGSAEALGLQSAASATIIVNGGVGIGSSQQMTATL
jgi:hypothetical protein